MQTKELFLFLFFYTTYVLLVLLFTSQFYLEDGHDLKEVLSWIRNLIVVIILLLFISSEMLYKLLNYYVNFIFILSLLAILMTILIYLNILHPLQQVDINGQLRELYIFGYRWADSWLGDRYNLVRLQSFADEAGTMAFSILPAILLAHMQKKYLKLSVMLLALFLTFSIGALIPILLLTIFHILKNKQYKLLLVLILFAIATTMYLDIYFQEYLSAKFGSSEEVTSLSVRSQEAIIALNALSMNIFGLGITSLQKLDISLAIGWVVPLIHFGIIAYVFYILAFFSLLVLLFKDMFSKNVINKYLALIVIILYYASMQRAQIDYNIWSWVWIIMYMRLRSNS